MPIADQPCLDWDLAENGMCCIAVCKQACPQVAAHPPLKSLLLTLSKVVLCPMASANAVLSNYTLSDMMASYMQCCFLNEAFPDLNSPTPETLLSLPVDATVAMNQIVSTITQAYHN